MAGAPNRRGSTKKASMLPDVEDEAPFETSDAFDPNDNSSGISDESDVSEYGRRGTKRATKRGMKKPKSRSTVVRPRRTPSPPEMSDMEFHRGSHSAESGGCGKVRKPVSTPRKSASDTNRLASHTPGAGLRPMTSEFPNVVQVHLSAGALAGGTTINLDISDLVLGKRAFDQMGSDSLPTPNGSTGPTSPTRIVINKTTSHIQSAAGRLVSKRRRMLENGGIPPSGRPKKGFCDLPYEIRIRIYRQVFVTEGPIDLTSRENLSRSSAFLRSCRVVHQEGQAVLYGENAFHFERCTATRGTYFEATWKEIGFKDVRRFLETIGAANVSMMRYISFHFQDAALSTKSYLDDNERRFVNDPILHHILKLIGANARLSRIAFQFSGRRLLQKSDYNFLQALSSIRSDEVIHAERMTYAPSKVGDDGIIEKLKEVMTIPRADESEVDVGKKKAPTVKMFHERPRPFDCYGGGW